LLKANADPTIESKNGLTPLDRAIQKKEWRAIRALLQYKKFKDSEDKKLFYKEFIKQHGLGLQFADEDLKKDEEVVLNAIKQDGLAFQFADAQLRKDKKFILQAIKKSVVAFQFADEQLKNDEEFILQAIKENIAEFQYARSCGQLVNHRIKIKQEANLMASRKYSPRLQ
jgi:hypothetical protein